MLNYYYRIKATAKKSEEELHTFLEQVGKIALEVGFTKAHVVNCLFKSVDQLDFARRICVLPTLQNDLLKESDFTSDPAVFRHEKVEGKCRIFPTRGVLLVITDQEGLETTFGFLKFPVHITGRSVTGEELAIQFPAGDEWRFEQFVQSGSSSYRKIVAEFESSGFLHSANDEYAADSEHQSEYLDYTPEHPYLIPNNEKDAQVKLSTVVETQSLQNLDTRTFLEGWWSLCWLYPGLHPDDYTDWEEEFSSFVPLAEEAFRRFEKGEISDSERYPAEATHNRIWRDRSP